MAPKYHSRIWGRLIFFLFILLLLVVVVGGGGIYWLLHRAQGSSSQTVTFAVRQGGSVNTVADYLASKHYIDSSLLFKLDARIHGLGGNLKVGNYTIRRNMSIDDMIGALSNPQPIQVAVTILPGFRAEQIANRLTAQGINGNAFLNFVQHPDLKYLNLGILKDLPKGQGIEGYLYPDTYFVDPQQDPREIARRMVENLSNKFTPALRMVAAKEGRSVFQILTLASIVEREARLPSDRPLVSSVYLNRLTANPPMPLDADPTVQYAVGLYHGKYWPVLWDQAVNIDPHSVFNTYTHSGLPPHPIAEAAMPSILATLYPKITNYLYFVTCKNGQTLYASTLDQQTANQQKCGG